MGYEISTDDRNGILEIRLSKGLAHRDHLKARDEALALCRARNLQKILVDARELVLANGRPSTTELFEFGASWAEQTGSMAFLLAGVYPRDAAARQYLKFGETVAFNRGFVTRGFDDIEQARAWLRNAGK